MEAPVWSCRMPRAVIDLGWGLEGMMSQRIWIGVPLMAAVVGLCVVMLGAFVRLSDAGLGCPDWPGCYGMLGAPDEVHEIAAANAAFPHRVVESGKAWKEMIHRYLASTLGLLVVIIAIHAWWIRRRGEIPWLPSLLLVLVIFQGMLGKWTVTHLVNPAIVTGHLLFGITTVALVWWLFLLRWRPHVSGGVRRTAAVGLALVLGQVFLGGWTSTNYAALGCTDFPGCFAGAGWPTMDFGAGFTLWRPLGVNYEFGVLDASARAAVHMTHRLGALLVLVYIGALAFGLVRDPRDQIARRLGGMLAVVLSAQVGLGIANVLGSLPLAVAVAHNGGALVLVLGLIAVLQLARVPRAGAGSTAPVL